FLCRCIYRDAVRRYLPSFPTRRSSDLKHKLPVSLRYPNKLFRLDCRRATGMSLVEARTGWRLKSRIIYKKNDRPLLLAPSGIKGDRKSTRLNSSHVSISYAVFCLKKKK